MAEKTSSQHLFADVLSRVHTICSALASEGGWPAGIDLSRVVVEPPRDVSHGDMATNAAMVLAKEAKLKTRYLAEPGFINLTLKPSAWWNELREVLRAGTSYGRSATGSAGKINVEYVSANP